MARTKDLTAKPKGSWGMTPPGITMYLDVTGGPAGTIGRTVNVPLDEVNLRMMILILAEQPTWRQWFGRLVIAIDKVLDERENAATTIGRALALSNRHLTDELMKALLIDEHQGDAPAKVEP